MAYSRAYLILIEKFQARAKYTVQKIPKIFDFQFARYFYYVLIKYVQNVARVTNIGV